MINYKCILSYDGTNYQGWQIQPGDRPTVQGSLINSCQKIFDNDEISVVGSGRTDAGVHALGQVVKITSSKDIPIDNLTKGLNSLLPDDIKVLSLERCEDNFHPVYSAKSKRYDYRFTVGHDSCPPQLRNLIAINKNQFNIDLAQKVCQEFIGKHDFVNFMNTGTPVKTTVREITACSVRYVNSNEFWKSSFDGHWLFTVEGTGFLKQMVRLMVGSLFSVAREHTSMSDFEDSLSAKPNCKIGPVAPANGLYLVRVDY